MTIVRAAQARPELFRALRSLEQTLQQGTKVEPGPTGNDRQLAAGGDRRNRGASIAFVLARAVLVRRRDDIDAVMGNAGSLRRAGFGGANLEIAVDGNGVAAHDLAQRAALL